MIDDVVPEDAWEHVPLTGERYLPWRAGWFQKSALHMAAQRDLMWAGMEVIEIWSEYDNRQSLGFDIVGSGRGPMVPKIMEDNAAFLESWDTYQRLILPRRRRA